MSALTETVVDCASFTTESISDVTGFAALREEWNRVLQSSNSNCLFLTWEWLYTWWKHLSEDRKLFIVAVRRQGEMVAVAPLGLRSRAFIPGRLLSVLEFLGSGNVGSDYLDFIARSDCEAEAIRAVTDYMAGERLVLNLRQLNRGGTAAARVAALLGQRDWSVTAATTNVCPFIPLRKRSWESYLAELGAEHRYTFQRKYRRLAKDFAVDFQRVRTEERRRESIDLLIRLHNQRWRARGGSDAFHTPGLVSFHQDFSRVALDLGWLRLYVLRLNGQPAASLYGFLYDRTFYFYQSGFDPGYSRYGVGLVAMGLAIKSAIEEGAEEYDLLHGDEDYKAHWSRERRELGRLELYPPGGLWWIWRASVELGRASKGLARRAMLRHSTGFTSRLRTSDGV
jgi:CelD/BcsL family acetyltransferase involved in cellulose biosynthesis